MYTPAVFYITQLAIWSKISLYLNKPHFLSCIGQRQIKAKKPWSARVVKNPFAFPPPIISHVENIIFQRLLQVMLASCLDPISKAWTLKHPTIKGVGMTCLESIRTHSAMSFQRDYNCPGLGAPFWLLASPRTCKVSLCLCDRDPCSDSASSAPPYSSACHLRHGLWCSPSNFWHRPTPVLWAGRFATLCYSYCTLRTGEPVGLLRSMKLSDSFSICHFPPKRHSCQLPSTALFPLGQNPE